MSKKIKLTQNKVTLVDNDDFLKLKDLSCQYHHTGYAVTSIKINNKFKQVLLHRLIMDFPKEKLDHINGNKLDNRKCNLRIATTAQNGMNRKKSKNKSSKYKGVSFLKCRQKWKATIYPNNKCVYIGLFSSEKEAALAYNKKALELFGNFARLNVIRGKK